jgi:hypothetical protein
MTERPFMRLSGLIRPALVVVLSACSATPASVSKPTKYPTYEMVSAMVRPASPTGDHNIAWIDDERVLFEGLDRKLRDPVIKNDGVPVAMRALYIWNVRKGEVIRHTEDALRSALCFADGFVGYSIHRSGKTIRMEGPFGQEQQVETYSEGQRGINRFTCKSYDRSTLPKPIVGGGIEPLRPEHGWIEHTGNSSWFRSKDGELTQLSYEGRPIGPAMPQKYSSYSQKYLLWRPSQNVTWLIGPSGTLQSQSPPAQGPTEGRLEPARQDRVLLRSTRINVHANWDPGEAGLYVHMPDGRPPERLITGLIDAMQVHSNGCLVATIVDPWDRLGRERRLMAVNTCQ